MWKCHFLNFTEKCHFSGKKKFMTQWAFTYVAYFMLKRHLSSIKNHHKSLGQFINEPEGAIIILQPFSFFAKWKICNFHHMREKSTNIARKLQNYQPFASQIIRMMSFLCFGEENIKVVEYIHRGACIISLRFTII